MRIFVLTVLKGCFWAMLALAGSVRAEEPLPVTIPLQVRSVVGARTPEHWPVTTGVPFRDGQLAEEKVATLRVETDSGRAVPAQFEVRGCYPKSRHVRWLGVDFQLDPAVKEYRLVLDGKAGPVYRQPVRINKEQETFVVTTGGLKAEVPRQGGLMRRVWLKDELLLEHGRNDGNWLTTVDGTRHGEAGAKAVVEREGPLHATIRVDGVYADPAGKPSCRWTARLHFYAGQPMIHLVHTFTWVGRADQFKIRTWRSASAWRGPPPRRLPTSRTRHWANRSAGRCRPVKCSRCCRTSIGIGDTGRATLASSAESRTGQPKSPAARKPARGLAPATGAGL